MSSEVILEREIAVHLLRKGCAHRKVIQEGEARVYEAMADHAGKRAVSTRVPEHGRAWRAEAKSCRVFARVTRRNRLKEIIDGGR